MKKEYLEKYDLYYDSWEVENPNCLVFISHGMAEHPDRYDYFAQKLNQQGMSVYAINHLGHGDCITKGGQLQGHFNKNGFYDCVENLRKLIIEIKQNKEIKTILFGHSMGSFISQEFIKGDTSMIDACILSGSNKCGLLHKVGRMMSLLCLGDKTKGNKFLNSLSFGSYNKAFAPNKTEYDWLSKDEKEVDKYVADPLCGYLCTTGFFQEFLKGLAQLNNHVNKVRLDLPIYIMSGEKDPVGENTKGVIALRDMYVNLGIKKVSLDIYENGRHEMLNETNKDDVIFNIIDWIKSI